MRNVQWVIPGLSLLALGSTLASCNESTPGGRTSLLTSAQLVGSWASDDGYVLDTFNADGTCSSTYADGTDTYTEEGTWSVDDDRLHLSFDESESEDGYTYQSHFEQETTAAIVDDVLYYRVYLRTSGSGASLDGTWLTEEIGTESESETGPEGSYSATAEWTASLSITITGTSFAYEASEVGFEEEDGVREDFDEHETGSGTIRQEGNLVYQTITELNGSVPDEEIGVETFMGWRVHDDVVVAGWDETEPVDGLRRQ